MRNFVGWATNKSFWAIILLVISIWSAFSFYEAGYEKADAINNIIITEKEKEIVRLRNMLIIENKLPMQLLPIQGKIPHP